MKHKRFFLNKISLLLLLLFCSNVIWSQNLTNSYKRQKKDIEIHNNPKDIVDINLSVSSYKIEKKKTTPKTIFDLKEKAQKQLIISYAAKDTSSVQLRNNILQILSKNSSVKEQTVTEVNEFPIRLNFLVEDKWLSKSVNNRIATLRIEIILKDDMYGFKEFIDFQNKYEYFDIGTIQSVSKKNFNVGIEGKIGTEETFSSSIVNANVGLSSSYSGDKTLTENVTLRKRFVSQTGFLTDNRLVVYMEGAPNRNLNEYIGIGVKLFADNAFMQAHEYTIFKQEKGKEGELKKKVLIKPENSNIIADVNISYLYRNIIRNDKFSSESKHVIQYHKGEGTYYEDVILVEKDALTNQFFNITYLDSDNNENYDVYFQSDTLSQMHAVSFATREEAFNFIKYVNGKKLTEINTFKLYYKKEIKYDVICDFKALGIHPEEL